MEGLGRNAGPDSEGVRKRRDKPKGGDEGTHSRTHRERERVGGETRLVSETGPPWHLHWHSDGTYEVVEGSSDRA